MTKMEMLIGGMAQALALRAESAEISISVPGGMAAAKENAIQLQMLEKFDVPRERMKVEHFYRDLDSGTLDSVWVVGVVDADTAASFLWGAADALVAASGAVASYGTPNIIGFAASYGGDACAKVMAILRDGCMRTSREWRRLKRDVIGDDDEPTGAVEYARLDIEDSGWYDEGIYAQHCAQTDEGATLITLIDLDCDLVDELNEMVEAKENAAAAARRRPVAA